MVIDCAKVQSVGHDFHYKATKLAEITVDENNPYLCAENSLLMSKDKKVADSWQICVTVSSGSWREMGGNQIIC